MDFAVLFAGFALPWILGGALLHAFECGTGAGRAAWRWGCGWFLGTFLLTVWMRGLSIAGIPFGVATIAGPLALAALVPLIMLMRQRALLPGAVDRTGRSFIAVDLPSWQRVLWIALLAWLAIRFALLLAEVVGRPLYPWDAWTKWATKARVWFAERGMAPFVSAPAWFAAGSPSVYFDAAPHYPATVPLTQTWAALLIGRWDDALVNVPWWAGGVALGLALFGALRSLRFGALESLTGTWLVLSMPILEVHIALAGYADLAMASYYTLAAIASINFVNARRWQDGALAIVLIVACLTIKPSGPLWMLTLVPPLVAAWNPKWGLRVAGLALAAVALAIVVLAQARVPVLGYQLQGYPLPWSALADAYLLFGNWNLLAYGAVALALLAWKQLFGPETAPYTLLVLSGLGVLLFGLVFPNAGAWVEDQSSINRATLHVAPLLVVWMLVTFRARRQALAPEPATVVPAA